MGCKCLDIASKLGTGRPSRTSGASSQEEGSIWQPPDCEGQNLAGLLPRFARYQAPLAREALDARRRPPYGISSHISEGKLGRPENPWFASIRRVVFCGASRVLLATQLAPSGSATERGTDRIAAWWKTTATPRIHGLEARLMVGRREGCQLARRGMSLAAAPFSPLWANAVCSRLSESRNGFAWGSSSR